MTAPITLKSAIEKFPAILGLIAVTFTWIHPGVALGASLRTSGHEALVFNIKQNSEDLIRPKQTFLTMAEIQNSDAKYHYEILLKEFLKAKKSPMADCTDILVNLDTHKKILSLSAAESSYGVHTISGTYNYWGVMAGRTLKKMGNSPCEAVLNMDKFLGEYPRRSALKYKDMTIDAMNGLYKQPRAQHWSNNNNAVFSKLDGLHTHAEELAAEFKTTLALAK